VFVTNKTTGASIHYWYDATSAEGGAFFPQQFPDAQGPICAMVYDGDGPTDRFLMLGGRDGFIRSLNPNNRYDDGTPISSYVYLGPIRPGGVAQMARCTDLEFYLGELPDSEDASSWNVNYTMQSALTAHAAFKTPKWKVGGNFPVAGRQLHRRQRLLGAAFWLKLANANPGDFWTLEQVVATFEPAGMVR
jgi:hypothetical protein